MKWPSTRVTGSSMTRGIASIAWTIALVVALAVFVRRDPDGLRSALSLFGSGTVLASAALVLLAKILLGELFGLVARSEGVPLSAYERQRTHHLAQVAKYLPGFIWQFASKGFLLRRRGASAATTARIIAVEQLWIIAGAALVGLAATAVAVPILAREEGLLLAPLLGYQGVPIAALAVLDIAASGLLFRKCIMFSRRSVAVLSLSAWIALSLSFVTLVAPAVGADVASLLLACAAFPIAWIGGYIVPFAPGGMGVREGVLAALLAPVLQVEVAVSVALMSRLVYIVAEVALAIALVKRPRNCRMYGAFPSSGSI